METATIIAQLGQLPAPAEFDDWIATAAFVLAILSLIISLIQAWVAEKRASKAEDIVRLLGEKETVAFAALKLQHDGLPNKDKDREHLRRVLEAILTACVFTNSDRARALLYDVLRRNRAEYHREIEEAVRAMSETFDRIEPLLPKPKEPKEPKDDFDLATGRQRLKLVTIVLDAEGAEPPLNTTVSR